MRASSVIDVQQSSLTGRPRLEDPELRRGFGLDGQVANRGQALAASVYQREERGQLRIGELESLRARESTQRVDGELFHARRIAHNLVHAHSRSGSPAVAARVRDGVPGT